MIEIKLELHYDKELEACLLDEQDMYLFIGENTKKEVEIGYYITQLCHYLNYPFFKNPDMAFDDGKEWFLKGWINGANYAYHHNVDSDDGNLIVKGKGYKIIAPEPFKV